MISRQTITHAVGTAIGLFVALYLEKVGNPYIAWFIGGGIIGVSVQLAFPVKRSPMKRVGIVVFVGAVAAAAQYLATLSGL